MPELRWILAVAGVGIVVFVYWYSRRRSVLGDRADAEARVEPGISDTPEPDALSGTPGVEIDRRAPDPDGLPPISIGDGAEPVVLEGLSARRNDKDAESPTLGEEPRETAEADGQAGFEDGAAVADSTASADGPVSGGQRAAEEERVVAIRLKAKRAEGFDGATLLRAFAAADLKFGRFDIFHRKPVAGPVAFSVASIVEPGSFDLDALPASGCPGFTLFMVLPGPAEPILALDDMLAVARSLAADLDGELLDERGVSLTAQREAHLREEIAEYVRRRALNVSQGNPAGV